jgi:hypothetical protein
METHAMEQESIQSERGEVSGCIPLLNVASGKVE